MRPSGFTVLIPSEKSPPCACGTLKVSIYRDHFEKLMDNMGSELGLEFVAGPFCPRCEAEAIQRAAPKSLPSGAEPFPGESPPSRKSPS